MSSKYKDSEAIEFLRHIMTLGLLRGSPRLTARALEILDGFEASDIDVSVTQDVLMTIKTCGFCGQKLTSTHQLHAIDHCAIHLKELLEAETKRADGLSEMVEMYKTMLKSKGIIIGQQERRINELAERLLKGGE